jgi:hypothetical protein
MKTYALIVDGAVLQLLTASYDPDGPGQTWVIDDGSAELGGGWTPEGGFTPAPPVDPGEIEPDTTQAVVLAQKAAAIAALPDTIKFLDTAERGIASLLFPEWRPGIVVALGEVYRWEGEAYSVIQAHTTQAGWEPPVVPALFAVL